MDLFVPYQVNRSMELCRGHTQSGAFPGYLESELLHTAHDAQDWKLLRPSFLIVFLHPEML